MTQDQLSKTIFPIGGMLKDEVRKIAKEQDLVVAEKAESMGICFVGEVDINEFLKREIQPERGEVVLKSTGEVIGEHEGVWFYTIGQRHGFDVKKYVGLPLYVVSKDVDRNKLIVGYYNDCMFTDFIVKDVHFVGEPVLHNFQADVRIRHLGQLYPADITATGKGYLKIHLSDPAFGVAPGQSAVFYQEDNVLGGGVITAS